MNYEQIKAAALLPILRYLAKTNKPFGVYGAGAALNTILGLIQQYGLTRPAMIVVDAPQQTSIHGIPLQSLTIDLANEIDYLIIGSDAHRQTMYTQACSVLGDALTIFDPFELLTAPVVQPGLDCRNTPEVKLAFKNLELQYRNMLCTGQVFEHLSDAGVRNYSYEEEDGIIAYLMEAVGTTSKICLDIAFGSVTGSNTANLLLNCGWDGILICGAEEEAEASRAFFAGHPDTHVCPPVVLDRFITKDNVNATVAEGLKKLHQQHGTIDFFSLDIDGIDYWIWDALDIVKPRVIMVEYFDLPTDRALTVPYREDFNRFDTHEYYCGATLAAFVKLGRRKGYRLVGTNRHGYNAFFVLNGIAHDRLPEIDYRGCFSSSKVKKNQAERQMLVDSFQWEDV